MKMHWKRVQEWAGMAAVALVIMTAFGGLIGAVDIKDAKGLLSWALMFSVVVVLLEDWKR